MDEKRAADGAPSYLKLLQDKYPEISVQIRRQYVKIKEAMEGVFGKSLNDGVTFVQGENIFDLFVAKARACKSYDERWGLVRKGLLAIGTPIVLGDKIVPSSQIGREDRLLTITRDKNAPQDVRDLAAVVLINNAVETFKIMKDDVDRPMVEHEDPYSHSQFDSATAMNFCMMAAQESWAGTTKTLEKMIFDRSCLLSQETVRKAWFAMVKSFELRNDAQGLLDFAASGKEAAPGNAATIAAMKGLHMLYKRAMGYKDDRSFVGMIMNELKAKGRDARLPDLARAFALKKADELGKCLGLKNNDRGLFSERPKHFGRNELPAAIGISTMTPERNRK